MTPNNPTIFEIAVTPTLDTSAYSTGDRLGSVHTLTGAARESGGACQLVDICIIDSDKQSKALDVLFFDSLPTVASADNAAIDITDAMMQKCCGVISIGDADYVALANSSVASLKTSITATTLAQRGPVMSPVAGATTLYAVLVSRGAPTYTAAGLKFRYKFAQY